MWFDGKRLSTFESSFSKRALLYCEGVADENADATLTMPREGLIAIINQDVELQDQLIEIEGDETVIAALSENIALPTLGFNIIEP